MQFTSTDADVATDDLIVAVNAAVTLECPLLVKVEPGAGKTELARQVASECRRSSGTSSPPAGPSRGSMSTTVSRLRDSQRDRRDDPGASPPRRHHHLEQREGATRRLPRRCFFRYIRIPDETAMRVIVEVHHPGLKDALLATALTQFYALREIPGLKKKPSTSEVLAWLKLLGRLTAKDLRRDGRDALPLLRGALLKNEHDAQLFERLAFMAQRER